MPLGSQPAGNRAVLKRSLGMATLTRRATLAVLPAGSGLVGLQHILAVWPTCPSATRDHWGIRCGRAACQRRPKNTPFRRGLHGVSFQASPTPRATSTLASMRTSDGQQRTNYGQVNFSAAVDSMRTPIGFGLLDHTAQPMEPGNTLGAYEQLGVSEWL